MILVCTGGAQGESACDVHWRPQFFRPSNMSSFFSWSKIGTSASFSTSLTFLIDYIRSEMNFVNYIGMVMINLQKAFDTVDHSILENKLKTIGLGGNAIAWFDSYLTNRIQVTDVGGIFSDPRVVPCGVPQGSILGPLLFLIYVNDMEASVSCKLIPYADDSAPSVKENTQKLFKTFWAICCLSVGLIG